MSQTTTPHDDRDDDRTTAETVVDEHRPALERLAAEDTQVGAAARAFLDTARQEEDTDA
jgi:hypothetical protein